MLRPTVHWHSARTSCAACKLTGYLTTAPVQRRKAVAHRRSLRSGTTASVLPQFSFASSDSGDEASAPKWYERASRWASVKNVQELEDAIANSGGKYIAVDFFAGWCSSCKSAFPALCKIPDDELIASKFIFLKANIEDEQLLAYLKKLSITGIPHLAVFYPDGRHMVGMTSSFTRMAQVRTNLAVIAGNPTAERFLSDPNGFVVPRF